MPPLLSTTNLRPQADCVAILVNPKAGSGIQQPRIELLADHLRRRGFNVERFTDLALATAQANRWHAEGRLRTLVGAGGDGTAAALVNGTIEGVPITVFPAGNSNLLARYLGLSNLPDKVCQVISDGSIARIDAGLANGRIFLLMAGCGFDAEVVRRVHQRRTGHISDRMYVQPILESIRSYTYPEIRVQWDDDAGGGDRNAIVSLPPIPLRWLFVSNLPCYAGNMRITPDASGSDGLFDVCGLRRGGFLFGLGYLAAILARLHPRLPGCAMWRAKRLRLTSEMEVPYQLDGDPGGVLPLDLQVLPNRLTLVVPKAKMVSR